MEGWGWDSTAPTCRPGGAGEGRGLSRRARPRSLSPGRATRYKAAGKQCACISRSRAAPGSVRVAVRERGRERARGGEFLSAVRALGGAHVHVCGLPGCPEPAGSRYAPGGRRRERGEAAGGRGTGSGPGGRAAGCLLGTARPRPARPGPGSCAPGGAGKVCFELAPCTLVRAL